MSGQAHEIQGIQYSSDLDFQFLNKEGEEVRTPINNMNMSVPYGKPSVMLTLDGKFGAQEVGFVYNGQHYHINSEFGFEVGKSANPDVIYIPLAKTPFMHASDREKGELKDVLGIAGSKYDVPLTIAHSNRFNLNGYGLFDNNGMLAVYRTQPKDEVKFSTMQLRPANFSYETIKLGDISDRVTSVEKEHGAHVVTESKTKDAIDWNNPKEIYGYLDEKVIGQESAKRKLAVVFSNYMTIVRTGEESLKKQNVLMIGPSGVGKTYSLKLLADQAGLPFVETKMSGKSYEGLVGENISSIFEYFRKKTADDQPYGIIFLDEIDKTCGGTVGNDSISIQLQAELVGWLEQAEVAVGKGKGGKEAYSTMDTKNIMFVGAGAFQGFPGRKESLATIIQKRLLEEKIRKATESGSQLNEQDVRKHLEQLGDQHALSYVTPSDIMQYGMIPELVGRLPAVTVLHPLSVDDKAQILRDLPNSPLKQNELYLQFKGYTVHMDPGITRAIAELTPDETGARGLESVCTELFTDIHFDPEAFSDKNKNIYLSEQMAKKLITQHRQEPAALDPSASAEQLHLFQKAE